MSQYRTLLPHVEEIALAVGEKLLALYEPDNRPTDRTQIFDAMRRNENAVSSLRGELQSIRPQATWLPDELESAPLPEGEWWVVDPVEGNINHVHGTGEWCVTITLVAGGEPVLAVVRAPIGDNTYTAIAGEGAHLGSKTLHVAQKHDLADSLALTGQAEHGQTGTHQAIARSIGAMLGQSLLIRATVPSTFPLLAVASGHADVFWQYQPTLPGVAAGVLLATEAGGIASRIDGTPWASGSSDILVSNPTLASHTSNILTRI
ncbi:inositol monophosphatase family protein [Rhodococcus erythropolis]|uniref:inositol monophosphatase family protein n=1 Tax=Rhodococcus erythropolis TaxID=1833 RepID=UPI00222701EA|nr:inositol monophosphatase family protein [Rhodococcus erythropolis]MCW2295477.1 myo-inositol-1(or 4)-monophosphatase [Rhodococcus erythropolis]